MSLGLSTATSDPETSALAAPVVSVIVPYWNEAGNLPRLVEALTEALDGQSRPWEVLLVDDGSTDTSPGEAQEAHRGDPRFRAIALGRHLGKSAALAAGRDQARGDVLVTLDADLQDPPSAIPRFLDRIDEGFDVVTAWRSGRQEPWHRRAASGVFNQMVMRCTGVPVHDMNAGLKAYRRPALESIHLSRGMHRFLAVFAHGRGFSVTELEVEHGKRHAGRTKYGAWRYAETVVGLGTALLLRRGPDAAMRLLVRIAALMGLVGALLLALGAFAGSTAALVVGCAFAVIASQLLVGRLMAEVLFQLSSGAKIAPPPVEYRGASTGESTTHRADAG